MGSIQNHIVLVLGSVVIIFVFLHLVSPKRIHPSASDATVLLRLLVIAPGAAAVVPFKSIRIS